MCDYFLSVLVNLDAMETRCDKNLWEVKCNCLPGVVLPQFVQCPYFFFPTVFLFSFWGGGEVWGYFLRLYMVPARERGG